jgi:putative ATP-binding cassette transporter
LRFLALLLRRSRATVLLGLAGGIANGLAAGALIALVHRAVSAVPAGSGAPPGLAPAYAALCLCVPLSRAGAELALAALGQRAILELRLELAERILRAPLRQLEELGAPRLTALLTQDVAILGQAAVALPALATQLTAVLGGFAYLAWVSAPVALLVAGFTLAGVWSYRRVLARGGRWFEESRREQDALHRHFRALTGGTKELKLHAPRRRAFLAEALAPTAGAFRRANLGAAWTYHTAASWTSLLFFLLLGTLTLLLPRLAGAPREAFAGSALVLLFILLPLRTLVGGLPLLGAAEVAVRRLQEVGVELAPEPGSEPAPPRPDWERLELRGVEHAYHGEGGEEGFRLGPVDLAFRRGKVTFLVGGNGSGKTTLAKLIAGLYVPDAGEVCLDGVPVSEAGREAYRQMFSAVFWDFFLFESLLGLEPGDGEVERGLDRLGLAGKVSIRAGRLSTTALSAGQRRRVALLVAWLEDRPVQVFDEWAADQDPGFKEVFYRELLPELKARGRTVFVVTHDDRYFAAADRVVELAEGRVVSDMLSPDP